MAKRLPAKWETSAVLSIACLLLAGCASAPGSTLPADLEIAAFEIALRDAHRHPVVASTIALDVTGGHPSSRAVDTVQKLMPDHAARAGHCEPRDERCLELRLEPRAGRARGHTLRIWSIRRNSASWCEYTFREDGRVWTGVRNDACGGVIGDDVDP